MLQFTEQQNSKKQLQRIAAQRQLYATAKKIFGVQVILGGPLAVSWALLILANPSFKSYGSLWGILLTLCDILWLTPWQKRLRDAAARVQEVFDCDVLSLPWNDLKAGKRPDPEMVQEESMKYEKWAAKMPPITNWYPPELSVLPSHIGSLVCQRLNCWWDSKQRRRYALGVIAFLLTVFVSVTWLGLGQGFALEDFILKVAAPLAPALLLGVRQCSEQFEAAGRLDKLKEHAERLWNDALSGKSKTEIAIAARNLQDEILEHRRRTPPVFDFIYRYLQREYEAQMNYGVRHYVDETKKRLGIHVLS